jgi:tetratricopeptide (TPR) repeat protein
VPPVLALAAAVTAGRLRPPPPGSRVPGWLRAILTRGLAVRPEDRWPSMAVLCDELEQVPARRRRMLLIAGGAGVLLVAAAGAFVVARAGATGGGGGADLLVVPCRGLDAPLAGVWDSQRAGAVRARFTGTGRSYAADSFTRVQARLDGYASAWTSARVDACEDTQVRGEQSEALLDLRMACLDRRLGDLHALVDVLAVADAAVLDRAIEAAAALPSLADCTHAEQLQGVVPPPADPAARARVDRVRTRVAEVRALRATGRYPEARTQAETVARDAEAAGHAPLLAEALYLQASLADDSGTAGAEQARALLDRALVAAGDGRDDAQAAAIWSRLVFVVGERLKQPDEALRLRPAAEAALRRAGSAAEEQGRLAHSVGMALHRAGKLDEARAELERSLALREQALGGEHPDVALSLNSLGTVLKELGDLDGARRNHERAVAIREKVYGPGHPELALSLNNLGVALAGRGLPDAARPLFERSLRIFEQAVGPDHPETARPLNGLGNLARVAGRWDEADRYYQRVLAIFEKAHGPEHIDVGKTLGNMGIVAAGRGDNAAATAHYARALAIFEKALGPDHPNVATMHNLLGNLEQTKGDLAAARRHQEQALAIWIRKFGPDHVEVATSRVNLGNLLLAQGKFEQARQQYAPALARFEAALGAEHVNTAHPLTGLARALLGLGRAREARPLAERAVKIRAAGAPATDLAESRFVLAQILWAAGEWPRALPLAEQARDGYRTAGDAGKVPRAEVERWLRTRVRR